MNNQYFQEMMRVGIVYRRSLEKEGCKVTTPLFSAGKSAAFKFWSISQQYQCPDVLVDELPDEADLADFFLTYREAQVSSIIITGNALRRIDMLLDYDCQIGDECLIRRLIENGYPATEVVKGKRVFL